MNKFQPVISPVIRSRFTAIFLSGVVILQVGLTHFGLPGWQCPILHATGIPCPGCGLSRSTTALLHGDWQGALKLHAFAPIFLLAFTLLLFITLLPEQYRQKTIGKVTDFEIRTGAVYIFLVSLFLYWGIRLAVTPSEFINLINNL